MVAGYVGFVQQLQKHKKSVLLCPILHLNSKALTVSISLVDPLLVLLVSLSTSPCVPISCGTLAASDWQVQSHLSPSESSDPKPAWFSSRFTRKVRMYPSRNCAKLEEIHIFYNISHPSFFHEVASCFQWMMTSVSLAVSFSIH